MYVITNLASSANMSIKSYEENGQNKQRLFSGGHQYWTLEPRGDDFMFVTSAIHPWEHQLLMLLYTLASVS